MENSTILLKEVNYTIKTMAVTERIAFQGRDNGTYLHHLNSL